MSKNKQNNDIVYEEEVVEMTPDEFYAAIEKFAENTGSTITHNADGTITLTAPDGGQVTTGLV